MLRCNIHHNFQLQPDSLIHRDYKKGRQRSILVRSFFHKVKWARLRVQAPCKSMRHFLGCQLTQLG